MSYAFEKIKITEENLLCRSYSRYPLALVKGSGTRLWDIDGKEYLDLLTGIGVTALGHCNQEVCQALQEQSQILWHVSNLFYQEPQLKLASLLLQTAHFGKVFFCNSGAEANEAAIKLARRYMRKIKKRDAYEIITLENCFHGRTLGALAATGRTNLCEGFTPLPEGFKQVPANNIEMLEKSIGPQTCAILLECVQGEAGVMPLSAEYLKDVESLCRQNDVLLICDEVQCGLCRTGKFWAFQHSGIRPDAITSAKALANGLPMGAMMATEEMAKGFEAGSHASTFGGGAIVSAAAAAVINIMQRDNLANRAKKAGEILKNSLMAIQKKYPEKIREVRSIGLMTGIELFNDAPKIWKKLIDAGIICNLSHNTTLRLLPALIITDEDLQLFANTLSRIIEDNE